MAEMGILLPDEKVELIVNYWKKIIGKMLPQGSDGNDFDRKLFYHPSDIL